MSGDSAYETKILTLVLIEGEQDEGAVVVEAGIIEKGLEPECQEVTGELDSRVVSLKQTSTYSSLPNDRYMTYIVDQVGGDEGPLRNRARVEINSEVVP